MMHAQGVRTLKSSSAPKRRMAVSSSLPNICFALAALARGSSTVRLRPASMRTSALTMSDSALTLHGSHAREPPAEAGARFTVKFACEMDYRMSSCLS